MSEVKSEEQDSLGHPPDVKLMQLVGAAHVNDFVNVYAVGSDGNLWGRCYYGSAWSDWANIGAPSDKLASSGNGGAGNVLVRGDTIFVFCLGNDGTVWCAYNANHTWQWMQAPGKLPGTTTVTSLIGTLQNPFSVTVKDSADQAFSAVWNGMWIWAPQPSPQASPNVTWESGGPTATLDWDQTTYHYFSRGKWEEYSVICLLFWVSDGEVICAVAEYDRNDGYKPGSRAAAI